MKNQAKETVKIEELSNKELKDVNGGGFRRFSVARLNLAVNTGRGFSVPGMGLVAIDQPCCW